MRFPRIKHVGNGVFREKHLTRCQCPVPDGRQGGTCGSCGLAVLSVIEEEVYRRAYAQAWADAGQPTAGEA